MTLMCAISAGFLPLPLEVLRPLGAPAIGPPPPRRSTAALFTDMEKFLCRHKWGGEQRGQTLSSVLCSLLLLFIWTSRNSLEHLNKLRKLHFM